MPRDSGWKRRSVGWSFFNMSKKEITIALDSIATWLIENPDHFTQDDTKHIRLIMPDMFEANRQVILENLHKIPWDMLVGLINSFYDITKVRYNLTYGTSIKEWHKENLSDESKTILSIPNHIQCVQMSVKGRIGSCSKQLSHLWRNDIRFKCTNARLVPMRVSEFFKYFCQAGIHVDPILKGNLIDIGYLNEQIRCQLRRRHHGKETIRSILPNVLANIAIGYAYPVY